MDESSWRSQRQAAIHLLRSGLTPGEVAAKLDRCPAWVYKWRKRFGTHQDWQALQAHSRAPKHRPRQLLPDVAAAVRQTRSELEAEAAQPGHLKYIGASAVSNKSNLLACPARLRSSASCRPRE